MSIQSHIVSIFTVIDTVFFGGATAATPTTDNPKRGSTNKDEIEAHKPEQVSSYRRGVPSSCFFFRRRVISFDRGCHVNQNERSTRHRRLLRVEHRACIHRLLLPVSIAGRD
eukprot:scaffold516_cov175-Amphora_coffeaeformis.AAC.18